MVLFTLVRTFDPIKLKIRFNLLKNVGVAKIFLKKKLFLCKVKIKNIFMENNSKNIWWKNFLCLDGAFKILVLFVCFL